VWTKRGDLVYTKIMQHPLLQWNLNGRYLLFVQHEKEKLDEFRNFQQLFIVQLSADVNAHPKQAVLNSMNEF